MKPSPPLSLIPKQKALDTAAHFNVKLGKGCKKAFAAKDDMKEQQKRDTAQRFTRYKKQLIEIIHKRLPICKIYLFGSRARGTSDQLKNEIFKDGIIWEL